MWRQDSGSILVTGVPVERGRPIHIEHDNDEMARTDFGKDGKVAVIHTPASAFHRVHEMMHARHSDPKRMKRVYSGLPDELWNVIEDCRIHQAHWPWRAGHTPEPIKEATLDFLQAEMANAEKHLTADPAKRGTWPDFAVRLRQATIRMGMGKDCYRALSEAGFVDDKQQELALEVVGLLAAGKEKKAGQMLHTVFFPPLLPSPYGDDDGKGKRSGLKQEAGNKATLGPKMEIIHLPLTEHIREAVVGYRKATSGSRLHRPSLRRPVLPQRLFIRRTPREPQGTILVDASGSMGDWNEVRKWCELAPFGTIAYYAGGNTSGWLYVYAKGGKKSAKIVKPKGAGNTVDGPAMDWLLTQPKPRRFITDRGFCGAPDSTAQVHRLAQLERAGEIEVLDYAHDRNK